MTKRKCKPCITISTVWKLAKIHFKHFMQDIRAFNHVQEYSCEIHFSEEAKTASLIPSNKEKVIRDVRELAASNYNENWIKD